jgi:predicted phosphate transport protein (TIGR00153 family)
MAFGFLKRKKAFPGSENRFFDILSHQSAKTVEGLEALWNFAENGTQENANQVRNIEREADELRRILIEELDQTFVTPIDREDIYALSRAIDDVVDYANTTVDEMEVYEVKGDEHIKEMINILRKAARELNDAVKILRDYPKISSEHAVKAKSYENQMEKAYHLALADLFKGTDTVYMLKMREIYRHLSNAADRGDEAANIISNIVMNTRKP